MVSAVTAPLEQQRVDDEKEGSIRMRQWFDRDKVRSRLKIVRKIWATVGSVLLVVFFLWMAIAYRPSAEAWAALDSDARVVVTAEDDHWSFLPAAENNRQHAGLVFFPGALVDARAYAPLMREVAEAGISSSTTSPT